MTEYDYSPAAYERYLATQRRIANWVDQTENFRPQFANALAPPSGYLPGQDSGARPGRASHRSSHRVHRSRSPSLDSASSDEYGHHAHAPGPMPIRSAPGHLGMFPQHQMPFHHPVPPVPPLASPPIAAPQSRHPMPPSYYGTPSYRDVKRRRAHSVAPISPQGFPFQYSAPPVILSPPVSPGAYGYPSAPHNYVMMPPQPVGHMGPQAVVSPPIQSPPVSAPVYTTAFGPASPPVTSHTADYFQGQPHQALPSLMASVMQPSGAQLGSSGHAPQLPLDPGHVISPGYPGYAAAPGMAPVHSPGYPQVIISSATTDSLPIPSGVLPQLVYARNNRHVLRRSVG